MLRPRKRIKYTIVLECPRTSVTLACIAFTPSPTPAGNRVDTENAKAFVADVVPVALGAVFLLVLVLVLVSGALVLCGEMAAPASTVVPAATPGPSPTNAGVGALVYLREVLSGGATVSQDIPVAIASEAAGLMQEVPILGIVCKAFLAFEQLVETARSNQSDLATLRDLCNGVIKGVLKQRKNRPGFLAPGFTKLEQHVRQAEQVAKLCTGDRRRDKVKRAVLASKISKDIEAVRSDILAFCVVNDLALADDIHVSLPPYFQGLPSFYFFYFIHQATYLRQQPPPILAAVRTLVP